uniref:Thioredoxin n=2 Tax=Salmo salar TaxID=8030 RepID=B9EPZ9_SALSA|nr:Thioredoxin [Salmo salar]
MILVIDDKDDFLNALKEAGDKLVVVHFTATWCGPCKNIAPFFKGLSEKPENSNVVFLKVDVDDAADVAQHCEIKCMPTFHFYKNGEKVDDFSGANQATLEEKQPPTMSIKHSNSLSMERFHHMYNPTFSKKKYILIIVFFF